MANKVVSRPTVDIKLNGTPTPLFTKHLLTTKFLEEYSTFLYKREENSPLFLFLNKFHIICKQRQN